MSVIGTHDFHQLNKFHMEKEREKLLLMPCKKLNIIDAIKNKFQLLTWDTAVITSCAD